MRTIIALLAAATLAGCVAAPERLTVQPDPYVPATGVGHGRMVSLSCLDQRPERRGGIPAGSYVIGADVDVAAAVCQAAMAGLQKMGFAPAIGAAGAPVALQIEVVRIAHAVGAGTFKREVQVEAELRATASGGGRQYTTSYRAQRMREVAFSPRRETVQALSDETISAALSRVLADPAILGVLTGSGAAGTGEPDTAAPAVNEPDTQTFPYP